MRSGGTGKGWRAIGLLLAFALALPGHADDLRDHDRARRALEAGEILPLKTVLEKIARDTPGQVLEVELERAGGSLVKFRVDARDGAIIPRQEQGATSDR